MKKIKSPFEVMFVIVDRGQGDKVLELLNNNHIEYSLKLLGHGTSENEIADLFGFGVEEKDIIISLVTEEMSKAIVEIVYTDLNLNLEHTGFVFTVQPNSSTLDLLNMLHIEVTNGKS